MLSIMKDQQRSGRSPERRSLEIGTARVEAFSDGVSGAAMWANLFLLFWLSLIPVLTEWLRDEYRHALPAAAYGAAALAAGVAHAILVRTLIRVNGPDSALARAIGPDVKGYASLVLYAAGVGLAFVSPWTSYAPYVAVALTWFVPDRRLIRS
jgi:uncharacterized membrane protein